MDLAIFCSGFSNREAPLQPWLTLIEVGRRLASQGRSVHLVTDGEQPTDDLPLPVHQLGSLRGTNTAHIQSWIKEHRPEKVIVSVAPFSLATAHWHASLGKEKSFAYAPYAWYTRQEIVGAWRHLDWRERWGHGRNLVVPQMVWRRNFEARFSGAICQSKLTAQRLGFHDRATVIPPGVDLEVWRPSQADSARRVSTDTFLFLGAPLAIRGFRVLLEAMAKLSERVKLRVLARGTDAQAEAKLRRELAALHLLERVSVKGGWLGQEEIRDEIHSALAVVLPFVLVPSELPVSVLEVIACGTPAIVSDIDGLPASVGEAGIVVPQANARLLAAEMLALATLPERQEALRRACLRQRDNYQSWDAAAERWAAALRV